MGDKKNGFRGALKLTGLMPVLPTPLREDESIDEAGVERLAAFLSGFPFCGIWAGASAGEDENIPSSTRKRLARLLVKHFGGRLPLLFKTSEPGTRETVERTKQYADLGIDIAIIHPQQKNLDQGHYLRALEMIADLSPVPVYLYHNPGRGAQLSLETVFRLSRHERMAGMKAGGSNLAELQRLALGCEADFSVFTAGAGQMLACLAMGVAGHMAVPLAALPEPAFRLLDAFRRGDIALAREWQKEIIDWVSFLPALGNREVCGETKALLEARGIIGRHVSAPFRAATPEQVDRIRERLANHPLARA